MRRVYYNVLSLALALIFTRFAFYLFKFLFVAYTKRFSFHLFEAHLRHLWKNKQSKTKRKIKHIWEKKQQKNKSLVEQPSESVREKEWDRKETDALNGNSIWMSVYVFFPSLVDVEEKKIVIWSIGCICVWVSSCIWRDHSKWMCLCGSHARWKFSSFSVLFSSCKIYLQCNKLDQSDKKIKSGTEDAVQYIFSE